MAIHLARLRIHAAEVAENFEDPPSFLRAFHNLLDNYANHAIRPGQIASPISVLPSYNVPAPILRHLELELIPKVKTKHSESIKLVQELWENGYLETQLLATYIFGHIHPDSPGLIETLNKLVLSVREPTVRKSLLTKGLARLRNERPNLFLEIVSGWFHPKQNELWRNGIQAIIPLVEEPDFQNIPSVFEIVRPVFISAQPILQQDIQSLILALYKASPVETSYFIRQIITLAEDIPFIMMIRRILPSIPDDLQEKLREALSQRKSNKKA